jgi:hypothetical protein
MPLKSDLRGLPASGRPGTGISPSAPFSGRGGPSNRFLGRSPGTAEPTERLTAYDSSFRKGKKGSLAAPIGPLGRRPRVKPPRGRPARPSGGAVGRDFGAERVSVPFSFSRALAAPRNSFACERFKKKPRAQRRGKKSRPALGPSSPHGDGPWAWRRLQTRRRRSRVGWKEGRAVRGKGSLREGKPKVAPTREKKSPLGTGKKPRGARGKNSALGKKL